MSALVGQKYRSMMLNRIIPSLCPDDGTLKYAFEDINNAFDAGDNQVFTIVPFILRFLCYADARKRAAFNVHVIKYETLLGNPREELEKIVHYLNKQNDNVDFELCINAMSSDSQSKSEYVSREKLSEFKQGNPITDELVDKIDMLFERYGLPPSKQFDNLFL